MVKTEQLPPVGTLHLELAAASFYAGDQLRGTVRIMLDAPVENAMVTVQISGLQRLHWMYIARGGFTPSKHDQWFKHLQSEFFLGELNGTMAAGTYELPFTFPLPANLIANGSIENVLRKQVDDFRSVHVGVEYVANAKLEAAGLSNTDLQKKRAFAIAPLPVAIPAGSAVTVEATEDVKVNLMGKRGPCTVRLSLANDTIDFPSGVVEATVEIDLPPKGKPHNIKLVLYEDVSLDRGRQYKDGSRLVSRAVCEQVNKARLLSAVDASTPNTVRGQVTLTIADSDKFDFGDLVPSVSSKFLQIRHRIGVECSFAMGSSGIKLSVPVTLVDRGVLSSTALPA